MAEAAATGLPAEPDAAGPQAAPVKISATASGKRMALWGILWAVAGYAIFALAFLYGVALLVWGGYSLGMSQTNGAYAWGTFFALLGVGIAMLAMLVAPAAAGIAVANRTRSHRTTAFILGIPAVIGAVILYALILSGPNS